MKSVIIRLGLDAILFLAVFMLPWWVSISLAIIFSMLVVNYLEILFVGLVIDSVQFGGQVGSVPFFFLIFCTVLYFAVLSVKKRIF
ncbi:MAG: hypothetical protein A3H57_01885 [Candidatus Taylorbacteria bacterium RIFCSPLOWO2_02_FULL_43_11]|uniref:Uncharacterized protein n=1 Tax=Candidatus Taylorbacteria bacterium RIFCSPHIGHO2_02_FULL_43_32b TaxID=1802306 RepID=A0A1G2MJN9_9BACT|nr:MAG: hypothetical protein A2743_03630 [Candidatus Taylorbacteria bacterium RIFCSPHIGHO2_01_FULL_43_47]OHA23389.1 MAG: hypothetical protein A3C72_03605 [Candidatus Taylorbacteria bacterium RIFCSPHIGHO2_02_FULL_43_32b]OHA30256.1 MAG: hypothetical protein A3B08_00050 [Candidatus Taylorbacteria bacterium RIFCSPLOWO2_01_FULL_43_44]OHA36876.1 MAG: hypothetical protein A3H57_01885 [Candidatus Taylorbacteria bacterium RIFCSPLOWO2_02_FULL_43_11]